jgi:hypothetical protein
MIAAMGMNIVFSFIYKSQIAKNAISDSGTMSQLSAKKMIANTAKFPLSSLGGLPANPMVSYKAFIG